MEWSDSHSLATNASQNSKELIKKSSEAGIFRANTLDFRIDALQAIGDTNPNSEVCTFEVFHPLMAYRMPVGVIVVNHQPVAKNFEILVVIFILLW